MKPIESQVLETDGRRGLLISRYCLDVRPYNECMTDTCWKKCTLRDWLNNKFMNKAFTTEEQRRILVTSVKNTDYGTKGGENTEDHVFLLSIQEAGQYFQSKEAGRTMLTEYAKELGGLEIDDGCLWWLRSPGLNQDDAANVFSDGEISGDGIDVDVDVSAVRPAIWIKL